MSRSGLAVSTDIHVTASYGFDMMALQETKKPWTARNRSLYDQQCCLAWPHGAINAFSSAPWEHDEGNYQAGGALLSLNGHSKGRFVTSGSDPLGRITWMKLRGTRDEGIIVINAYRVCQSGTSNPDAFTQFQQERTGLRARGIKNPDPRKQILSDILTLIDESRLEGYRPILCWDANEDWVKRSHPNEGEQLTNFMRDAQLADPFYNKFGYAPRTYVRSNNRLDYILVDPALTYSIKRIGYMENSEANFSDHALAYIDFDEKMLFRGLVNRPTEIHSRQFMVEQTDKKLVFTTVARTYFLRHKIPTRVFKLVALFAELGPTSANIRKFRRLDEEIISLIKAAAGKTLKKKFGYMRSPELATAGQILCLYKCIQSCLIRRQPIPESCVKSATRLETDISFCDTISVKDMRRKVAEAQAKPSG